MEYVNVMKLQNITGVVVHNWMKHSALFMYDPNNAEDFVFNCSQGGGGRLDNIMPARWNQ